MKEIFIPYLLKTILRTQSQLKITYTKNSYRNKNNKLKVKNIESEDSLNWIEAKNMLFLKLDVSSCWK